MSDTELDKSYDPHTVEQKWYEIWNEKGFFKASEMTGPSPTASSFRPRMLPARCTWAMP